MRLNALKLAPTPTNAAKLHRMWIPCPHAIKRKHLAEELDELAKDDQPQLWKDARQARLLQDFKLIPNAGFRFTCKANDSASKLSLLSSTRLAHKSKSLDFRSTVIVTLLTWAVFPMKFRTA